MKKHELQKLKQEKLHVDEQFQLKFQQKKDFYERHIGDMQAQNQVLQQKLKEAQELNVDYTGKIISLEQQLKDSQFLFVASSFSIFSKEEFKELALKIHEDHKNLLVKLFEGLNDIQET